MVDGSSSLRLVVRVVLLLVVVRSVLRGSLWSGLATSGGSMVEGMLAGIKVSTSAIVYPNKLF